MDGKKYFDSQKYFRELADTNIMAKKNGFKFCTCSGIQGLEGPLSMMRTEQAFFCLDDINDGALIRGRNGGWFKNRTMAVFLLRRFDGSLQDRDAKLGICRELFRQVVSKMIVDERDLSRDMILLQTDTIMSSELGNGFLPNVTGLYFMVDIAEPVDLIYDKSEWTQTGH